MIYKLKVVVLLFVWLILSFQSISSELIKENFECSLTRHGIDDDYYRNKFIESETRIKHKASRKHLSIIKQAYEKYFMDCPLPSDSAEYRIPRIIHQIWLGSPVPQKYKEWMVSWTKLQGWEYKLWTDEEVKNFPLYNKKLYDQSENYGEKSDILRYEILFKEGGLYVDTDFECLSSDLFEFLHKTIDFYAGIEPLIHAAYEDIRICNALIGSKPGHKLLEQCIKHLESNFKKRQDLSIIEKSGPIYLSTNIFQYFQANPLERNVILPCGYIYPYGVPLDTITIFPESAAIHYWEASWAFPSKQEE